MQKETKVVITAETDKAEKKLHSFGRSVEDAGNKLSSFSGIAGALSIGAFAAMLKKSIDASTEYQNSLNGLASVARYAGEDIGQTMNKSLDLTKDGMLSTAEGATALKNLLAKGFSTDQAVEMIMRFKDAAAFGRQGSLEFGEAVVSATEGIKNNISNLVDNAGVTKNISVMQKEYAASIGKTVGALTEAEQRQAIYTGVLKETEAQLGNAALAGQGVEGANARMNKSFNDSAITIGQIFTPAWTAMVNGLEWVNTGMRENVIKPFFGGLQIMAVDFAHFVQSTLLDIERLTSPSKWGAEHNEEFRARYRALEKIAEEEKQRIVESMNSITPQMGKDTGVRRNDVEGVTPAEAAKQQKGIDTMLAREQAKYDKLHEMAIAYTATDTERVTWKLAFDLAAMDKEHEEAVAARGKNLTLDAAYQQARIERMQLAEAEEAAIATKKEEREEEERQRKMRAELSVVNFDKLLRRGDFTDAMSMAGKMTAGLATHSRAAFEINKVAKIAELTVTGIKATGDAYDYGMAETGSYWGGIAYAAITAAWYGAQISAANSTHFGGGGGVSSPGGGGVPSQATLPGVPVSQQPAQQPVQITIYNTGNVLSDDYIENNVITHIQDAVNNRDLLLFDPRSRQAAVLAT